MAPTGADQQDCAPGADNATETPLGPTDAARHVRNAVRQNERASSTASVAAAASVQTARCVTAIFNELDTEANAGSASRDATWRGITDSGMKPPEPLR